MTVSPYEKYISRNCYSIPKDGKKSIYSSRQLPGWGGGNFSIDCTQIVEPQVMIEHPHQHAFDQYLCFFGTNPRDIKQLGGVVEICLGPDQEKFIIDVPAIVHVAPGLFHGPLVWAKVEQPMLFVDVAATNTYSRVGEGQK